MKVNDPKKVDPTEFSGNHQLHLTRMRVLDNYEVEHAGRRLKGGRTITSNLNLSKSSKRLKLIEQEQLVLEQRANQL